VFVQFLCKMKKRKKSCCVLLTIAYCLLCNFSDAQKLKTLVADGDKSFADNDFFSASIYYNKALLQDSTDVAIQYKYAEASRLNFDVEIADHWYSKVYKKDPQGKVFPECVFWLASLRKSKGKYKDAKKLFDKYAKKNKKKKDSYFVKKALQEIAACDYSQFLVSNPNKEISIIHLDSTVNSKVSEYAPVQFDSILYFSSLRNPGDKDKQHHVNYNKIYTSVENSNSWQKARELDSIFNREGIHNANTAFNSDHTKAFISRCRQKDAQTFDCEIYASDYKNGHWQTLVKLPETINQKGVTNTQPAVGMMNGEEVLFFSSNREGGQGRMDIWYSKVKGDIYNVAVNAGKKINTLEDEITPYYHTATNELYFSSTWHKGLGGFDIFKVKYMNDQPGEPQNLGVPVNTSYNDIYFSINNNNSAAFLSSNRLGSFFEEKESCCNDIYMFKTPKIAPPPERIDSTRLLVTQMKLLVPLTLYFHNDEPDKKTLAITTTKNYKKTYEEYAALRTIYKNEYSKGAKSGDVNRAYNDITALFDDSVDAGMQDLEKFAQLLLKVLKDKEKVVITIKGFCSPLASTDYNINLAKRRISSLRNYFSDYQNGIFLKYIDNRNADDGSISFIEQEVGELKARTYVSDDYYDTKNSVYSPAAALERKIQIIAISTVSEMINK
jgi:hypothetical protein